MTPEQFNRLPTRHFVGGRNQTQKQFSGTDYTLGLRQTINGLELFKSTFKSTASAALESLGDPIPSPGIHVGKTCFVMTNGIEFGVPEKFDLPFISIQTAIDRTGPDYANWCVIVYPGEYAEDVVIPENLSLFFHPGVTLTGNIVLGNGCHLHFMSGSTVVGNISDGGVDVEAHICGCMELRGVFELTGTSSYVTAEGEKFDGCNNGRGNIHLYFKELTNLAWGSILVYDGGTINVHGLVKCPVTNTNNLISASQGFINVYDSAITTDQDAIFSDSGIVFVENSSFTSVGQYFVLETSSVFEARNCTFLGNGGTVSDSSVSTFYNNKIASNGAVRPIVLNDTVSGNFYGNYITAAASSSANLGATFVATTAFLTLSNGNTLVSKGTGNAVTSTGAVNIVSLPSNNANTAVGAGVTETPSVNLFVDPLVV